VKKHLLSLLKAASGLLAQREAGLKNLSQELAQKR
jgi:hypothetical protein